MFLSVSHGNVMYVSTDIGTQWVIFRLRINLRLSIFFVVCCFCSLNINNLYKCNLFWHCMKWKFHKCFDYLCIRSESRSSSFPVRANERIYIMYNVYIYIFICSWNRNTHETHNTVLGMRHCATLSLMPRLTYVSLQSLSFVSSLWPPIDIYVCRYIYLICSSYVGCKPLLSILHKLLGALFFALYLSLLPFIKGCAFIKIYHKYSIRLHSGIHWTKKRKRYSDMLSY